MKNIQQLEKEILRLKSAVEELSVLNELALAVGSSLEANQVLDIIVQKSVKAVRAEQGSIMLVTELQDKPLQTLIRREDYSGPMQSYRVGTHITGWVLKNKQPLMIENLAKDNRFTTTEKEQRDIHSVLCVPIWFHAKIIGILMVTNKKTDDSFNSNDLRLLSIIAAQSGQLIRNSQLQSEAVEKKRMDHELDLARKMQMSLLPQADPKVPGLEIASYFKPADAVGGDYFDYFSLGEQKFGIVIADVSGHGPPAALVMTLLKGITHSITQEFHSASQSLADINSVISQMIPEDVFVTIQFLVFDLKNKILLFSNAGHNPPVFYDNTSDSCNCIELAGCALNLMEDCTFQLKEIPLKTNDLFLVYTDGIIEVCNNTDEMLGLDQLKNTLLSCKSEPVEQIISNIKRQIVSFTGKAQQADDMAMIAIRIL